MSFLSGILKGVGTIFPPAAMVGGALDDRDARKQSKNALNISNLASDREYQRQKEFAQNQIRWRVDDAKAAGLHPLYALGQSSAAYSPSTFIPGQSETGSFSSDGLGATVSAALSSRSPSQKRLTDAQIRKVEAEASLAETQALDAKRRLAEQPGRATAYPLADAPTRVATKLVEEPYFAHPPLPESPGVTPKAGIKPYVRVQGFDGRWYTNWNPTVFDEISQFGQIVNDASAFWNYYFADPARKVLAPYLK